MECDSRTTGEPLRQGDIFQWRTSSNDPWKRFGVIVTADCDIANEKYGGALSYCPILTVADYLRIQYLPREIAELRKSCLTAVAEDISKIIRNVGNWESVSPEILPGWIGRRGVNGVLEDIGLDPKSKNPKVVSLLRKLDLIADFVAVREFARVEECLDLIGRARANYGAGDNDAIDRSKKQFWKNKIAGHFDRLPGDWFYINHLDPQGRDEPPGYVVCLRRIGELPADAIAIRQTDLASETCLAIRIGRLKEPYRYRLTQQLGAVFSDIGLPDEYTDLRRIVVGYVGLALLGE